MANGIAKRTTALKKRIEELQEVGERIWANKRQVRAETRRHVADLYFLHREFLSVDPDLLTEIYRQAEIQYKRVTKQQYNFSPFLRLIWGTENCTEQELHTYSRALNAIDQHVKKNAATYKKDGIEKLANFIKTSGGIQKLAGYGIPDNDKDADQSSTLAEPKSTPAAKQAVITAKAATAAATLPVQVTVTTTTPTVHVQSANDDLGVLLIRRTNIGYEVVGSSREKAIIKAVATDCYRRSFAKLRPELRGLLETLRTQCLPAHLIKVQEDLVDVGETGHTKERKALAARRLLVCGKGSELLLSPTNAKSGVVTNAKLKGGTWIKTDDDLMLSYRARKRLECDLVSNYEFHLYKLGKPHRPINYDASHEISFVARLQDESNPNGRWRHLDFWRSEESSPEPLWQVAARPQAAQLRWSAEVDGAWFREVAFAVLDMWLEGSGKHIKRKEHTLCRLTFNKKSITFEFTKQPKGFEITRDVPLVQEATCKKGVSAYFLTKDIIPALRAIADFDLDDPVKLKLGDETFTLEYSTAAADYSVVIPQTSEAGHRFDKWFDQYTPQQFRSLETDYGVTDNDEDFSDDL